MKHLEERERVEAVAAVAEESRPTTVVAKEKEENEEEQKKQETEEEAATRLAAEEEEQQKQVEEEQTAAESNDNQKERQKEETKDKYVDEQGNKENNIISISNPPILENPVLAENTPTRCTPVCKRPRRSWMASEEGQAHDEARENLDIAKSSSNKKSDEGIGFVPDIDIFDDAIIGGGEESDDQQMGENDS